MAGIAFDIRKLLGKRDVSSFLAAFLYSGIVSSGPWLFSVFALGILASFGKSIAGEELINLFMGLVIYVFAFSMVLTYGSQMVITRYLADCLYRREDDKIPSLMLTTLFLLGGGAALIYAPFVWSLDLKFWVKVETLFLFILVASMWGTMIYVSTLKAYVQVTIAFIFGFGLAVPASLLIGKYYGLPGFLFGLNIGIASVVFLLCSRVLIEFDGPLKLVWGLFPAHKKQYLLFFYGAFTGLGIWADKFLFWNDKRIPIGAGLFGYPYYDGAMFLAYLTVLPSLAYFILIAETDLYENIRKYNFFMQNHGNLATLEDIRLNIANCLKASFSRIAVFQGIFTLITILVAPAFLELLDMSPLQISIMRIGMLAAYFQMGMMLFSIVLTYFKAELEIFFVAVLFLTCNLIGTWFSLKYIWFHGYGFFLASLLGFLLSAFFLYHKIKTLHYTMIAIPDKE